MGLKYLHLMPRLKHLRLDGTAVTDAGIGQVAVLRGLVWLDVGGTAISDEGVAHIVTITRLEMLVLSGTKITNLGANQLVSLEQLGFLALAGTEIDDDALPAIARLKRWKSSIWMAPRSPTPDCRRSRNCRRCTL